MSRRPSTWVPPAPVPPAQPPAPGAFDTRAALAHYAAVQDMTNAAANAELVRRVNAEAKAATAMPRWWPVAAGVVLLLTLAISDALPWGWAQ